MKEQAAEAEAQRRWGAKAGARRVPNGELLDADYLVAAEVEPGKMKFNLSRPFGRARQSWEAAFRDAEEREGKCPQ
jgi:hypothetical protein